tara:strand:+ start:694 stop:1077 length:384 start_codon:yes stop_codon:yes gene_type:complete
MRIQLNIAQVTAVIDKLESTALDLGAGPVKKPGVVDLESGSKLEEEIINPKVSLAEAIVVLKTAVQEELQSTQLRLDSIIKELKDHGYTEVTAELTKVKQAVETQNTKTQDKYFDENGTIKDKLSEL